MCERRDRDPEALTLRTDEAVLSHPRAVEQDLRRARRLGAHLALGQAVGAGEVELEGVDAGGLAALHELDPGVLAVFLHDGGDEGAGRPGTASVRMIELGRLMGLTDKPSEKQLRELAEAWRPHRGAAAVLAWHSYNSAVL